MSEMLRSPPCIAACISLHEHGALPDHVAALIAYEVLQVVEKCHELRLFNANMADM
jgi:hypothetical protein